MNSYRVHQGFDSPEIFFEESLVSMLPNFRIYWRYFRFLTYSKKPIFVRLDSYLNNSINGSWFNKLIAVDHHHYCLIFVQHLLPEVSTKHIWNCSYFWNHLQRWVISQWKSVDKYDIDLRICLHLLKSFNFKEKFKYWIEVDIRSIINCKSNKKSI